MKQNSDKSNYIQLSHNNSQQCSVVTHKIQNNIVVSNIAVTSN